MVANEYIAARLARMLGLPVAALKEIQVKGPRRKKMRGMVSIKANAKEVIPWKKAKFSSYSLLEREVHEMNLLVQMLVFDAWILNLDRTNRNLILYRNRSDELYNWYLIDHGIALFGSPVKWKRSWARKKYKTPGAYEKTLHRRKCRKFLSLRVPKGLKAYAMKHRSATDHMISRISRLSRQEIDRSIRTVPKGYLKPSEKAFVRSMLLKRQKHIRQIVDKLFDKMQVQAWKKSKTHKNGSHFE